MQSFELTDMALDTIASFASLGRVKLGEMPDLIAKMHEHPSDAARFYMGLFQLFTITGNNDFAQSMQARALALNTIYRVEGSSQPSIRLLAFMVAGTITDNTPLDYLIENSDIQLDVVYLVPGEPLPDLLPEHDVAIIAFGESDKDLSSLEMMKAIVDDWPRPILNRPQRVLFCARDKLYALIRDIPDLLIMPTLRVDRASLENITVANATISAVLGGGTYPITVRPLVSHGGKGLSKIENVMELQNYLANAPESEFFVSFFSEYRSVDGYYRKVRIALIDGVPYVCHLAIGEHWIVHYQTANMADSIEKREEEARFMREFDTDFARRHQVALSTLAERLGLDYVVIDCAETIAGELLIFEIDNRGWIHATDDINVFGYKQAVMNKAFAAFRAMLVKAMHAC
ncbi:ATP-grasp domain-containing protein [Sulfuriferula nivalis]|uniref:ATP-grasp domain-containing protein n=1 Tax=Sulfuriferula nivalis TaxID=2675298 RepID=A0A809S1Z5_9PROT|nr:RimK family alpha-L-glutamate ligase [Sulfuriferula nivalis]BBP00638.1 hypothetical protein SFSGTM_13460 [Sulfuriferula nivalis]